MNADDETNLSPDRRLLEKVLHTRGVEELLDPDLLAEIEGHDVANAGPWGITRAPATFDPEDNLYCVPPAYWVQDNDDLEPGEPIYLQKDGYGHFPDDAKQTHLIVVQYRFLELCPPDSD